MKHTNKVLSAVLGAFALAVSGGSASAGMLGDMVTAITPALSDVTTDLTTDLAPLIVSIVGGVAVFMLLIGVVKRAFR
jgi:hypothetical protein